MSEHGAEDLQGAEATRSGEVSATAQTILAQAPGPGPRTEAPAGTIAAGDALGLTRPAGDALGPDGLIDQMRTMAGDGPSPTRAGAPPEVPGYEIEGELGRGGMGVIYRARQVLLNRSCALKMILAGAHASPEEALRFLGEAEAVARLQHPNVVQIHAIGEASGLPFFELELVEGGSLDHRLDGTPWRPRLAAELAESLARGIAEAHRLGIVHRDLKPANVLIADDGTPKIADFGLAKILEGRSGLTATESILGSPSYMAPEQAEGHSREVGPAADTYAIGAILYELLVGRPPFRGASLLETLEQVRRAEPVPPSKLVPGTPRDLETICLKCLQKDPARRYESAAALADDLRAFLDGRSIAARPVSKAERAWRWCRRNPTPTALTSVVVLVAVAGLAGILWQWREAVRAREVAAARAVAEAGARREAQQARAAAEVALVDMYTATGIQAGDRGAHAQAALWFANAARLAESDPDRREANRARFRSWSRLAIEPVGALPIGVALVRNLEFHLGGRHLIVRTQVMHEDVVGDCLLWDLRSDRPLPWPGRLEPATAAVWSPDGGSLAVADAQGRVVVAQFPGGEEQDRFEVPARVRLLSFSPDGRHLAIAFGESARVRDCRDGTFATPELAHPGPVMTMAFDPEGRRLATGCSADRASLFAVGGEEPGPLWTPVEHLQQCKDHAVRPVAPIFVEGGRRVLTLSRPGALDQRDSATGKVVRTLTIPDMDGDLTAAALAPGGQHLAVAHGHTLTGGKVQLLEIASGLPVGPALRHANVVSAVSFSPDGRMLLTGSPDRSARLWSVPDGELLGAPIVHPTSVLAAAFAPDGRSLATAQQGGPVRHWRLPGDGGLVDRIPLDGGQSFAAISPDGTLVIPSGIVFSAQDRKLRSTRAYEVATGRPAGPILRPGGAIHEATFSPDGRSVALVDADGPDAQAWDWSTGERRWQAGLPSVPRSLDYSPDGGRIAILCEGEEVLILDASDGREVHRWPTPATISGYHYVNNGMIRFSPDGRSVLAWFVSGFEPIVWDADTGKLRYEPLIDPSTHDVRFSPDGHRLATAGYDSKARIWDFATGVPVAELPAHPDWVFSARFSPDGRLLVTACRDGMARVWDWRTGRLACPPFEHADEVFAASFTPDGRWVVTTSLDGTARAWDWRTGKPVTPSLPVGGRALSVEVTPDGRHAVVGGFLDELAVIDLGDLASDGDSDPEALILRAELLAGQRIHEGGGLTNLSAAEWFSRWEQARTSGVVAVAVEPLEPEAEQPR